MFVKPCVGTGNQLFIESPLICAALIAAHLKLGVKFIVKEHVPRHGLIMALKTYYFKVVMHGN